MTKFVLIMFLCSAVPGNECQLIDTPINDFKTYHECAYYGYDYSSILLREFSTDFVDILFSYFNMLFFLIQSITIPI